MCFSLYLLPQRMVFFENSYKGNTGNFLRFSYSFFVICFILVTFWNEQSKLNNKMCLKNFREDFLKLLL